MIRKEVMAYLKVTEDKYKRNARNCIEEYRTTGDQNFETAAFIYRNVADDIRTLRNSVRVL